MSQAGGADRRGFGRHLLALTQLAPDACVHVISPEPLRWVNDLPHATWEAWTGTELPKGGSHSSVLLWDPGHATAVSPSDAVAAYLKTRIAPEGRLLCIRRNPMSFEAIARALRSRSVRPLIGTGRRDYNLFERSLKARFSAVEAFMCLPNLEHAEEFTRPGSRLAELPSSSHPARRWVHRLGQYQRFHEGFLTVCGSRTIEEGTLFQEIRERLDRDDAGASSRRLVLERFDPRMRGALVLLVTWRGRHDEPIVVRICDDSDERTESVRRNHATQQAIHANPNLPDAFKALVPRPLDHFSWGPRDVFVESRLGGVVAWKAGAVGPESPIRREADRFLSVLETGTAVEADLEYAVLDSVLPDDWHANGLSDALLAAHRSLSTALRETLFGRRATLSLSHGDFGPGNLLTDKGLSRLLGVIDWASGRNHDLSGIDRINLDVQCRRISGTSHLPSAIQSTFEQFPAMPSYCTATVSPREIMALSVLRMVSRDVDHLATNAPRQKESVQALEWARGLVVDR